MVILRRIVVVPALVLALGVALKCASDRPLRVATYNIRRFGVEPTDLDRLTRLLSRVDADILAVQEIQDLRRFEELRARLSRGGRDYGAMLSRCGGKSEMLVGFLYDKKRVIPIERREYPELQEPGEGRCHSGERAALLGVFAHGSERLHLLVMHLTAGGDSDKAAKRRDQWRRVLGIADELRAHGASRVAILGDTNSTGYLDNRHGERDYIRGRAADHKLEVVTHPLPCSEYFHPAEGGLQPSLLDHVVATPELARPRTVRVHGYCAELECQPQPPGRDPAEFATVSDHCPVSFEMN
jgi:endonuclease/exonuclease/phosphatase family metal-dependent hydrolase